MANKDVDSLRAAVKHEWDRLTREYVRDWCRVFRGRVENMVTAEGGVFEKEQQFFQCLTPVTTSLSPWLMMINRPQKIIKMLVEHDQYHSDMSTGVYKMFIF